jgi:hypothetical protein
MQQHKFELFADYFQFYLQDEKAKGDLSESWTEEATQRLLAIAPETIGVGTVRNMTVPVSVEIHDAEPTEGFDKWDHVVECSLNIPTGNIVVAGCTDYFPDATRIKVHAGCYRARIFYGALDTLSENGLEGDDHYKIVLWPASVSDVKILKQRQTK